MVYRKKTEGIVKCSCGKDCTNFNGNYLCQDCDQESIRIIAKEYTERALKDAIKREKKERENQNA